MEDLHFKLKNKIFNVYTHVSFSLRLKMIFDAKTYSIKALKVMLVVILTRSAALRIYAARKMILTEVRIRDHALYVRS